MFCSLYADAADTMNAKIAGVQTRDRSFQPLPQPRSLAAAMLEMQLTLLGSLLAVVSQANQLQVCPSLLPASWGNPLRVHAVLTTCIRGLKLQLPLPAGLPAASDTAVLMLPSAHRSLPFLQCKECTAVQILEVLNAAANEGTSPRSRRERAGPARRHILVTCACAAALAGLHALAQKYRGGASLS